MRFFCRTGWVNEGTKRKCNYYHRLSHTPKGKGGSEAAWTRLHTHWHSVEDKYNNMDRNAHFQICIRYMHWVTDQWDCRRKIQEGGVHGANRQTNSVLAEMRGGGQGYVPSIPHQRNRTCFVYFCIFPLISIHRDWQKHILKTSQMSSVCLSDLLLHFAISVLLARKPARLPPSL